MNTWTQDLVDSGLAVEQQSWAMQIERSLQGVTQNLMQADAGERPDHREGWLLIERSLRMGAESLQAMRHPAL
jgi:hypothetical protein